MNDMGEMMGARSRVPSHFYQHDRHGFVDPQDNSSTKWVEMARGKARKVDTGAEEAKGQDMPAAE
jgi:hypothetical protein